MPMATADTTPELATGSAWVFTDNGSEDVDQRSDRRRDGVTFSDMFVTVAVTLVTIAIVVALLAQTSIPVMVAVLGSGCAWCAMIIGHVALRRAEAQSSPTAAKESEDFSDAQPRPALEAMAGPERQPAWGAPDDMRDEGGAAPEGCLRPPRYLSKVPPSAPKAATDQAFLMDLDLGDFRPKPEPDLSAPSQDAAIAATPRLDRRPSASGNGTPVSGDMDSMLKRLAQDIKKGRKGGAAPAVMGTDQRVQPKLPSGMTGVAEALRAGGAVTKSTGAVAADATAGAKPPPLSPVFPSTDSVAGAAGQELPPLPVVRAQTARSRLAAIADALSDERMDVFLETINGLDDYRARHYQVSVRLRLADGEGLNADGMISETRGTGLLPLIEAVKISSAKRVAEQMIRRGRSGDFFSIVDGEALETEQFSDDMDTIVGGNSTLASRLVLAFSQSDVRSFTPGQWDSLREIANIGFRFSIEDITDLDMDFEKLGSNGFVFAKLDAEVFLKGLPIESGHLPASDICRYLSGAGLALIVGQISDETTRAKIMGFGALFGQGALFGGPRPVRSDVLRRGEVQTTAG